jgi:hypothetical protein
MFRIVCVFVTDASLVEVVTDGCLLLAMVLR